MTDTNANSSMSHSPRAAVGGLTLAIVLAAALAGLSAAGDSPARPGDRPSRSSRPLEVMASLALGYGLVATTLGAVETIIRDDAEAGRSLDRRGEGATSRLTLGRCAARRGETDLPPPAIA